MNLLDAPKATREITNPPLIGVIVALALATIPLAPRLAGWVLGLFFIACAARLLSNRRGARLPSLAVKVVIFALGVGGVVHTFGKILGIEPGLSILVVLVSLKLIEASSGRDFQFLTLLGFFLALCNLFFSQDLILWLYVASIVVLLTATLIRFYRGPGEGSYRRSFVKALALCGQAAPILALLFLFVPRTSGGLRYQFSQSLLNSTGMSDRLSPGSIASLALNDEIAFRVDFPDSNVPPISAMYWRGAVLWRGEGLTWIQSPPRNQERRLGQLSGPAIRQRIILQPHGAKWLFALDRPASEVRGATYQPGGYLQSRRAITNQFAYEVISRPDNREASLPAEHRVETLRQPVRVSPRVQALVENWRRDYPDPRELVEAALRFFRHERFVYTLDPGTYQEATGLDEFLFERREGFCEHYAAAFATLMRLSGIPARVIIGYHGGELNPLGRYVIVRQADSHAWAEVWIKGIGWQRIDPTDMIAPERISSGLASYLETRANTDPAVPQRSNTATGWRELLRDLRLVWDSLNYQWDLRVLNFDEETQRSFLFSLGFGLASWAEIGIWVAVMIGLLLAMISWWLRRSGRIAGDEIARGYARFCEALERAGLRREPWEGPQHFGEKAATRFSGEASFIRKITAQYIALRYGAKAVAPAVFLQTIRKLPRFTAEQRTTPDTR